MRRRQLDALEHLLREREADIVELRLAGMLAKPFKPTELIDLVRKALREDTQSLEGEA